MTERRVRVEGRQVYGRVQPLARPRKPVGPRWQGMGLLQRRLVLLVIGVLLLGFWLSKAFAVRHVEVQAAGETSSIQSTTVALLQSSALASNLLTLDPGWLTSKLQQAEPALRGLTIQRKWPHTVVIVASLQRPSLGWSTDGSEYLLDHDGTVIGAFPSGTKLPVVTDSSNLPVTVGKQVVSPAFVGFVQALTPALAANGYGIKGLSIQDTTFDLTVATNKNYSLIFDTTRAVSGELADLQAVQKVLTTQKQTPASYIDLRIAGKAYYK